MSQADDLASRECVPCRGGTPPVAAAERDRLHARLDPGWSILDGRRLAREFRFPDFAAALAFTNRVGEIAATQNHHPDIALAWGRAGVTIWTHVIDGLTENDFILAAKIDRLPE